MNDDDQIDPVVPEEVGETDTEEELDEYGMPIKKTPVSDDDEEESTDEEVM